MQMAGETPGETCHRASGLGTGSVGCLCLSPMGMPSPIASLNHSGATTPAKRCRGGGAVAGVPALRGRLHKPCFSGKAAKNSQGRCATGCTLPVPGLFYIAAALGLGPRARTVPGGEGWGWGGVRGRTAVRQPPQLGCGQMRCPVPCTPSLRAAVLAGCQPGSRGTPNPRPTSRGASG